MTRGIPTAIALAGAVLTAAATARAEPFAWGGEHDVGALAALAEEHYDLEVTDAVFLLDGRYITFRDDGTRETTVHRIVWISTELATDSYADLRVPYDTATSTLEVHSLRTWRDERWWPHESELSPTAVVETTPRALVSADDYTSVRETMLLHDGVEIPCILETAYTITESRDPDTGAYGLWIVPRSYPSIRVELSLTVPKGKPPIFYAGNGAPEPRIDASDPVSDTYSWTAEIVDRLGRPVIDDPACYAPHVEWSTWPSEATLAGALDARLEEAVVLNDTLRDTIARLVEHERVPLTRARAVVDFIDESTRLVRYDGVFWQLSPRAAARTWETAYGHRLDRAVLAAALFREVGMGASFVYRSAGYRDDDALRVPGLGRYDGIAIWVDGDGLHGYYDPASGSLEVGSGELAGRAYWHVTSPSTGRLGYGRGHRAIASAYELALAVEPGDEEGFRGEGFVHLKGWHSPYDLMAGLGGESEGYLERVARSAFEGATVTRHNVLTIDPDAVVAGFAFDVHAPEPDAQGRIEVAVADPPGGILGRLPADVHLYSPERRSPVVLAAPATQEVELRIRLGDREVVRRPEPRSVENGVGRFSVTVEEEGEWITVTRSLSIGAELAGGTPVEAPPLSIEASQWPELRELLLEETDRRNRSVFLR